MENFDVAVLGAGLGGLSAAACLTRLGYRVVVLEQHYLPGGCCHTFPYGKYRFCADVHYISGCGPEETIGRFLRFIDRPVEFNSLDPDCIDRVITPEVDFRIPLGWEWLRTRLVESYPEEAQAIHRYCDTVALVHRQTRELLKEVHWYDRHWYDWLKLPKYWELYRHRHWTLQDLYDAAGLSPRLQAILAGQSGDYALPPAEIALLTHSSLVSDYARGAYYPRRHFEYFVDQIVDAIESAGSQVRYRTPVERLVLEGNRVVAAVSDGRRFGAETFISDLDPKRTAELLGGRAAIGNLEWERLTGYEYSASAFNLYLGLNEQFEPRRYGLGNWNIWYYPDGDLNQAYQRQLAGELCKPWIFLSCPTLKTDAPGLAPPGHHVLEVATVSPYAPFKALRERDPRAYLARKREMHRLLMESLKDLIPDVERYIRCQVAGTPTTSEYFLGQPVGNIYGAKLVPRQVGLHRLGYRTALANLYLVGASAGYPSVPGVIGNGMDVSRLVSGREVAIGPAEPSLLAGR